MATVTTLVSDLSGTAINNLEDGRTLEWAFDGQRYKIDLTTKEIETLRKSLTDVLKASTQVSSLPALKGTSKGPKYSPAEMGQFRVYGRELGFEVPERGRIKQEIMDAVIEAHPELRRAGE